MFKASISKRYLQVIQQRAERWAAVKNVVANIHVPEDMIWWYYNEFGTANLGVKGGKTYPIPSVGTTPMTFPDASGALITRLKVNHPGIKASHMVGRIEEEIRSYLVHAVIELLPTGDFNPSTFKQGLLETIMVRVKELIKDSFATHLTGIRPDGKLNGKSAAEVFDEQATVVEIS